MVELDVDRQTYPGKLGSRCHDLGVVLVQREMESGRAPLASITPIPRGSSHSRKSLRPAAAATATGFKKKEVSLADLIQQGPRRSGRPTGYEKNIEHTRCRAPQQATVPGASRWRISAAAVASGVRRVLVSG